MESIQKTAVDEGLGYKEAIEQGAAWCVESGSVPSKVISDDRLDELTSDAFREFARQGWMYGVSNLMHAGRSQVGNTSAPVRVGEHPVTGRNPFGSWKPLDMLLRGKSGNGEMKRLGSFELEDLKHLRDEAVGQERGWRDRRLWSEKAQGMLEKSRRAKTIEQLSKSQVNELSELAKAAWS